LGRREAKPLYGFIIILRHGFALRIYQTQPSLRPLVPLGSKLAKEFDALGIVAAFVRSAGVIERACCGETTAAD